MDIILFGGFLPSLNLMSVPQQIQSGRYNFYKQQLSSLESYFCFLRRSSGITASRNELLCHFQLHLLETFELKANSSPGLSQFPSHFLAIACTADVILLDTADIFQIWLSQLFHGYEEFACGSESITNLVTGILNE